MTRQRENECPKCHSPLGARAKYCGCGWKADDAKPAKSAGITNCAWIANGEQCQYPGTVSHNTQGMGPWYCRFHAAQDVSQHHGEQLVRESRSYRPLTMAERDGSARARLGDPDYRPKFRACEELRCLRVGTLQPNGRHLCATHKHGEVEYAKRGPRGSVRQRLPELPPMRQPGEDLDEMDFHPATQA